MTIEKIKSSKKMNAPFTVQKKVGAVWRNEAELQEEGEAYKIAEEVKAAHPHNEVRIVAHAEKREESEENREDEANESEREAVASVLSGNIFSIELF